MGPLADTVLLLDAVQSLVRCRRLGEFDETLSRIPVRRLRCDKTGRFLYSPSTESFAPVSEALLDRASPGFQVGRLPATGTSKQAAISLAEMRSRKGLVICLDVLDAQRTVPAAEQQLIQTERTRLTDMVSLFRALGEGWKSEELRDWSQPRQSSAYGTGAWFVSAA